MATIYVIAGPPGVGKSTSGRDFIPKELPVLDADLIAHKYKQEGFSDYKDIGNWRFQDLLRNQLVSGNDFAVELNLGYQNHYDLLKKLKSFNKQNSIEVILFHTTDLDLCLERARVRHENGLHLVEPSIIREMYSNTIPLLIENIELIAVLTAIDVRQNDLAIEPFLSWDRVRGDLKILREPEWLDGKLVEQLKKLTITNAIKESPKRIDNPKATKRRGRRM